jgi:hypothetical protein
MRLVFALIVFFISGFSYSQQRFNGGLKAGISTSQIDGDGFLGYNKAGPLLGAFVNTGFNKNENMSLQMELMYISKGSRRQQDLNRGVSYMEFRLAYIEVPLLFKYTFSKFTGEAGLSYGTLIEHKEFDASGQILYPSTFKKNEFAFNAGLNYSLINKLSANIRFSYSILPVRDFFILTRGGFFGGSYNNVLAFSLIYQFKKVE